MYIKYTFIIISLQTKYSSRDTIPLSEPPSTIMCDVYTGGEEGEDGAHLQDPAGGHLHHCGGHLLRLLHG